MSRRQSTAKKYAFIRFACDGKTLHLQTKELRPVGPLQVNGHVYAPWEGGHLRATVLGLSNDPTVLTEIERKFERSLERPKQKGNSKRPISRKTSLLVNRTKTLHPVKTLKRKPSKDTAVILKKSHNASALTKNILYQCFTLGELYQRNTSGQNFNRGLTKKAINPSKFQELLGLVKLHYDDDHIEKTVHITINKALSYLWNRKLNLPWLVLPPYPV